MRMGVCDTNLKAPFPYFGGKSLIASVVWDYLGDVKQYIEPFFGSGAVLLKRPPSNHVPLREIVNDKDGFIANVWRAIKFDPAAVAEWCDWPVNHADLVARRKALLQNETRLLEHLCDDPEWFDAKMAGYWVWAASCWIGPGLICPGAIPELIVNKGIHSKIPYLTTDQGIHSQISQLTHERGIHSGRPHLAHNTGLTSSNNVLSWLQALAVRLRNVKVVCGDWTRVCGGNWQNTFTPVGMFFDPPYATSLRRKDIYLHDSLEIGKAVEQWVQTRGRNPDYRIIVCGYEGEYEGLIREGWSVHKWKANGGYGNRAKNDNRYRERLFISPHCLQKKSGYLF